MTTQKNDNLTLKAFIIVDCKRKDNPINFETYSTQT